MVEPTEQRYDGIVTYSYKEGNQYPSLKSLSNDICDSILSLDEVYVIPSISICVDGKKLSQQSNQDLYHRCFSILKNFVYIVRNERREKVKRRLDEELGDK